MVSEQSQAHRTHKYVNNAWSESSNSPPTLLFIPLSRRQDMLLLWQTRPHCTILLQGEKQQGEGD